MVFLFAVSNLYCLTLSFMMILDLIIILYRLALFAIHELSILMLLSVLKTQAHLYIYFEFYLFVVFLFLF